jgi:hypothetical protein
MYNTQKLAFQESGKKQFPNRYIPQPRLESASPVRSCGSPSSARALQQAKESLMAKLSKGTHVVPQKMFQFHPPTDDKKVKSPYAREIPKKKFV